MNRTVSALRLTARLLSALILVFWGFFILAHLLGDAGHPSRPITVGDAAQIALMLLELAGLALAWRHELAGAVATLAAAVIAACFNPHAVTGLGMLPALAALLFLLAWWTGRALRRRQAA